MSKYTARQTEPNISHLTFADILESVRDTDQNPIEAIEVSYPFYKQLCKSAIDTRGKRTGKEALYLTNLYGVKIYIDPKLKPGEYKIRQN